MKDSDIKEELSRMDVRKGYRYKRGGSGVGKPSNPGPIPFISGEDEDAIAMLIHTTNVMKPWSSIDVWYMITVPCMLVSLIVTSVLFYEQVRKSPPYTHGEEIKAGAITVTVGVVSMAILLIISKTLSNMATNDSTTFLTAFTLVAMLLIFGLPIISYVVISKQAEDAKNKFRHNSNQRWWYM